MATRIMNLRIFISVFVVCSNFSAVARDADGKLDLIFSPNDGRPAFQTLGSEFSVLRKEKATLELIDMEHTRTPLTPVWVGGRINNSVARCKVPPHLKPGQYSIRASTPGHTDTNTASIYILPRKPLSLTLTYAASTESIELTETSESDLHIFVVPMQDHQMGAKTDILAHSIPTVRIPRAGQEQPYKEIYGALPYSVQIGQFGLILFDVSETRVPQLGLLHQLRRLHVADTWTVGITHRSPVDLPVHVQLMLFDDDPLDVVLAPISDDDLKNLQPWKRTLFLPLPRSSKEKFNVELDSNTVIVSP